MGKYVQLDLDFPDEPEPNSQIAHLLTPDEIYARAQALVQLLKEDRRIERKPAGIHVEPLGEYFSMWANTSPEGGVIAIGIGDKGQIQGCRTLDTKALNRLEKTGLQRCPQARYETKRVPMLNEKGEDDFILLIRVQYHPTRVVETCDGKVFKRVGDSKIEVKTDEERHELRIDKGEVQYEQEPVALGYPVAFDIESIRRWANNVRKSRKLTMETTDEKILELFHLGKRKGQGFAPNIACALLFANDPLPIIPGCKIRFLRFDGTTEGTGTKYNAVRDEWIEGSIPRQIVEISKILSAQIRTFSGLGKDNLFHTTPEYPEEAWYEAIVNACAHRSYNMKNMNIFVKMFDDRLEVDSPGPFPPSVTPETIYKVQHSRNPFLMSAMYYLGYVKCANEGCRRMRDAMLEAGLPEPKFSQIEVGGAKVKALLTNNIELRKVWVDTDVAKLIGERLTSTLSEKEKIVVNFVAVHGHINVSEAQRLTGHNWHTSRKLLMRLVERGIFRYIHRDDVDVDRQAYFELDGNAKAADSPRNGNGEHRPS